MFTYIENKSANDIQTTRENAVLNIEIAIGQDISMEIQTRMLMVIPETSHIEEILEWYMFEFQLCNTTYARL